MVVFYILLFVPMMIQHFTLNAKQINYDKKNQRALLCFFVFLTILVMLRHSSIGSDTRSYIFFFNNYANMSWKQVGSESLEFGFAYFNKIISIFTEEPQIFLAIAAIAISTMIYPTYRRLCIDPTLTIVLFCTMSTFVMMFSGIRQMLAIGMGILAYECVRNKKIVPFICVVILAITFHTSAFMLAFMYPLYYAKITKKWLSVVVPVLIVTFVFNRPIFSFLSLIIERYTVYEGGVASTGAYAMLILFAVFTVFAFLIPDDSTLDGETIGLRNFLLLSLTVQLFAPLHSLAMRMNYYYIIFIPLLIPKIIRSRNATWDQVAIVARYVMIGFFLIYFFISAYTNEDNLNVFPYHFFWEAV